MAVVERGGGLVGREAVLGVAEAALDEMLSGAGQLLLVTGEPGIGKSAVLTEVARRGAHRGSRVLRGVCWRGNGAPPYWPWTQVLRGVELDHSGYGEAGRLLAGQPEGGLGSAQEAADARFRLFDSVAGLFTRLARDRPLLIILDDLQWADSASVQLLDFVARQCAAERVLLLGAYRNEETAGALLGVGGQVLPLTGLSPAEVGTLIAVIGGSRPSEEQAGAVWRRSGGNPLFVRELTRLVLARGDSAGPLPDSVRQTLTERLARVSPACAEMLEVAAVDGLDLQLDVLSRALDLTSDSAADLLDEAVRARVVALDHAGAHFVHDLFRETILARLSSAHRAALHATVGRALQSLRGGGRDVAEVGAAARLAAHFVAAGPTLAAEALDYSVRAAQEATARLGHAEAVRHYEAALGLVGDDAKRRVELLFALAGACDRAGDSAAARSAYRRVADAARSSADWITLARAGSGLHALGSRAAADERECTDLLTEANARLSREASPNVAALDRAILSLRSEVLAALARIHRHTALRTTLDPKARGIANEAIELARAANDPAALGHALLAAHDVGWEPGSAHERLPIIAEMADAADQAADADLVAEASLLRAAALIELGDPSGRAELSRYTILAEGLGHARGRWGALSRRATLAGISGRIDEAMGLADAALNLGLQIGVPDARGCFSTLRGSLAAFGSSMPTLEDLLPDTDPLWPVFPLLRAWTLVSHHELEPATTCMRAFAIEDIEGKYDLELLAVAAFVCAAVGSDAQREWVYARLQPHAGTHAVVGGCAAYHGCVDHHLGLLAAALSRGHTAALHFDNAIAQYERLGAPAWAAISRSERDRLQAAAPGDEFRYQGTTWQLVFDGQHAQLPDAKGLHDIAALLRSPGHEIHVFSLLGLPASPTGADVVLDEHARSEYGRRLAKLEREIAVADAMVDPRSSERATSERDALVHELSAATGLGGRQRRLGDQTERARKTVGARIRDALARIERVHPLLAGHLRLTLRTGTTCAYVPPDERRWRV
jgi:hypothetical protein